MNPRKKSDQSKPTPTERPAIEETVWDALEGGTLSPDSAPENGDLRYVEDERPDESPEEDDDNAYNESDDALPSREGEKAIDKNPSKEGGLFDEV